MNNQETTASAKEKIKSQALSIAVAAILSSGLSIALIKSPVFPLLSLAGTLTGGALAFTHEGSPNRKARILAQREAEVKTTETALAEIAGSHEEKRFELLEEIEARKQAVQEALDAREASIEGKIPSILATVEKINTAHQEEIERLDKVHKEELALKDTVYHKIVVNKHLENESLKEPDLVEATCFEESQANDAIRCLAEYGIIAKEPAVAVLETGFVVSFKVLPKLLKKNASKEEKEAEIPFSVAEAGKIIQNRLLSALRTSISQCEREPSLDYEFMRLKLIFDTRPVPKKQRIAGKDAFGVLEPDGSHFTEFMDKCSHLAFFGNTGRGKSVAIRNAVGAMMQSLGGEIEVVVGDPKFTEAMRDLNPQYVGARECLIGIRDASEELTRRLEIREANYRANRPYQEFSKTIYFFDEVNELLANFNKPIDPEVKDWLEENDFPKENAVSIYLSRLWRLSREVNIVTLVAGQNLKPSALKINVVELGNFGMIFFGDAIQEGIDYRCKGTEGTTLECEYQLRRKRAEESDLVEFEFYALYALPNMKPYFAALPKPKTYAVILADDVITDTTSNGVAGNDEPPEELATGGVRQSLEALFNKESSEKEADIANPQQTSATSKKSPKTSKPQPTSCPKCGSSSTKKNGKGSRPNTFKIVCKDCGKSSTIEQKAQ